MLTVEKALLRENISIKLRWRGDDTGDFDGVDDFPAAGDFDFVTFDLGDFDGVTCDLTGVKDLSDDDRSFDGVDVESLEGEGVDDDINCLRGVSVTLFDRSGAETPPSLTTQLSATSEASSDESAIAVVVIIDVLSNCSLFPLSSTSISSGDSSVTGIRTSSTWQGLRDPMDEGRPQSATDVRDPDSDTGGMLADDVLTHETGLTTFSEAALQAYKHHFSH